MPRPTVNRCASALKRAVEIATSPEGNTYIQLSDENVKQAKSRSQEARSALLPDIEAQAEQTTAMKSLAALGLDLATDQTLLDAENDLTGALAPTEKALLNDIINDIPRVVGPFNSVDVRAKVTQSVFDFSSIRRYQASRAAMRAAADDRSNTDDTDLRHRGQGLPGRVARRRRRGSLSGERGAGRGRLEAVRKPEGRRHRHRHRGHPREGAAFQ